MASLKDEVDDLQGTLDDAREILEQAYTPEATRADLVNAVGEAIDVLAGEDEEDDDSDDSDDSDDDGD